MINPILPRDFWQSISPWHQWSEYVIDAMQRSVLFLDTLHERGNIYLEHRAEGKPPVLVFPYEILMDGRDLEHPCNYLLLQITPGEKYQIDPDKRPYVIVDPRAGHGPGIGGFKEDSQIGFAMKAGHPVYFISFYPEPVPGQTLGDVARAEALFLDEIHKRHPNSPKPCVQGNCQAGWAVAALAALAPDLMGPIVLNGAPLSYWAGVEGANPMRYSGGLLGGKWLATLTSDLGNGVFDGAWLVSNFENLNPANTLWTKQYNLYANIDTEPPRYLAFEKWWGAFYLMNAEEMDAIVTQLFIGNRLARGEIEIPGGENINLKNIKTPIIVFASWGDNITPPQQALNWLIDVYGHEDAIIDQGQVVVYMVHEKIGHLGIFVSGSVARKEHKELIESMDMIERLLPGLYEMVIKPKKEGTPLSELVPGDFTVGFEHRTIDDIRAMDDDVHDDAYFAPVVAVSDFNEQLYKMFLQPWVQAMSSQASAVMLRELHPMRLERSLFSDTNPFLWALPRIAEIVKQQRIPAAKDNPYRKLEGIISDRIVAALDAFRDIRDGYSTELFKAIYGPTGLGAFYHSDTTTKEVRENIRQEWRERHAHLLDEMDEGGMSEAVTRIVFAVLMDQGRWERRTQMIGKEFSDQDPVFQSLSPEERKALGQRQAAMLWLDRDKAYASLTKLLPTKKDREEAMNIAEQVLAAQIDANKGDPTLNKVREVLGLPVAAKAKGASKTATTKTATAKTQPKNQPAVG